MEEGGREDIGGVRVGMGGYGRSWKGSWMRERWGGKDMGEGGNWNRK